MSRAAIPSAAVPVIDMATGLMNPVWYQFFLEQSRPIPGWSLPTGTLSRATFDQSSVTTAQLAQRVAALITDEYGRGKLGA